MEAKRQAKTRVIMSSLFDTASDFYYESDIVSFPIFFHVFLKSIFQKMLNPEQNCKMGLVLFR